MNRNTLRAICVICGTALFITYAVTGKDGVLVGTAGTLLGVGIDVLRSRKNAS